MKKSYKSVAEFVERLKANKTDLIHVTINGEEREAFILDYSNPTIAFTDKPRAFIIGTIKKDSSGYYYIWDGKKGYPISRATVDGNPYIYFVNYKEEVYSKLDGKKVVDSTEKHLAYLDPRQAAADVDIIDGYFEMLQKGNDGFSTYKAVHNFDRLVGFANEYSRYTKIGDLETLTKRVTVETNLELEAAE